ncbi:Gfo/Idh/MocA family oxidoreductase [Helicobacter enhydrae]|uniref:Gfo/Idh/MocA family oxidoreductase n=1 Tax=Helicobacter enhydrae TaxID=222136 RepID=UPI0018FFE923|nr:Gfo/Idh/MocA family oxidoreductase [Helicobacter enhydrae]
MQKEEKDNFGIKDANITHIWTQDLNESQKIAQASNITHICQTYHEMIDQVQAVIIARDDWRSHIEIALPFLEAGKNVFIDKPLSLSFEECEIFQPYIKNGKLISFSSLKFSPELDSIKTRIKDFGEIKLIRGITPKTWEKYAIHLLDGIRGVLDFDFQDIVINRCQHESLTIYTKENILIQLDCLGNMQYPMLQLEFFSSTNYEKANCLNAFVSFKRMLEYFVQSIKGQTEIQNNLKTLKQMEILIKGQEILNKCKS